MKQFIQNSPTIWESSASIAANGTANSGSHIVAGYARLVGMVFTSASLKAGSGIKIKQSPDDTPNWDYSTDDTIGAGSCGAYSIDIVGRAVQVDINMGGENAGTFRAYWRVMPI